MPSTTKTLALALLTSPIWASLVMIPWDESPLVVFCKTFAAIYFK